MLPALWVCWVFLLSGSRIFCSLCARSLRGSSAVSLFLNSGSVCSFETYADKPVQVELADMGTCTLQATGQLPPH
jgi:hypothetical protein